MEDPQRILLSSSIRSIFLATLAAMSVQARKPEHSGKIEAIVNPAGTHHVTLAPMHVRGAPCDTHSVSLTAQLITQQFNHLWERYSPEVIVLGFLSPNRELFADGITIETPRNSHQFPPVIRPGRQTPQCTEWEHRITLTRNQFLWIANAPSVKASGANSDPVSLSADHMAALRDLASRMEPEESVVKPPDPEVISFEGDLFAGLVYEAKLRFRDDGAGWGPVDPTLRVPSHHALRLEWLNLSDFPTLTPKEPSKSSFWW